VAAKIQDLQGYLARFPTWDALTKDGMAFDAVLMCLLQIGETLQNIKNPTWSQQLPVKGAYVVRNIIAHDYEGVDSTIVERIVTSEIPALRDVVDRILADPAK